MFINLVCLLGGNVHIHYTEEKCYDEEIFFYHLGCHQWVSVGENLSNRKCTVLEKDGVCCWIQIRNGVLKDIWQ